MTGFLKDDLTVALDEVDRVASRTITVYHDLSSIAGDRPAAPGFLAEARRREAALARFNQARRAHGQIPETEDPERGHLHAVWLKLKALVATEDPEESVERSLAELDDTLREVVAAARALHPDSDICQAMEQLIPNPHVR
jgi:hypothetical protein